jgi:hypothetical protein
MGILTRIKEIALTTISARLVLAKGTIYLGVVGPVEYLITHLTPMRHSSSLLYASGFYLYADAGGRRTFSL